MPNQRTIPSAQPKSVVTYTILSGGVEISDTWQVLSVQVNHEINRVPSATILLLDGGPSGESFPISNESAFEPGKEIEIKLGYRSDEESVFKGIVIRHGIKIRKSNSVLQVECRDKVVNMTMVCRSKYFNDQKDSSVMEELASAYSLETDIETTDIEHQQLVQYNSTDWDFMLCRADANGLLVNVENGKLSVASPALDGETVLTLQYGATIHELDAEIDSRLQYKAVKASSWDYSGQELIADVEAEEPTLPAAGNLDGAKLAGVSGEESFNLFHSGKITSPELQSWVNAKLLRHRLARIRGRVTIEGTPDVKPGTLIELLGVGDRFQGKLFVTGVRHALEQGNWETSIQFGLNPEWFAETFNVQQPLAGAMLPAIRGLQVGVVTKLEDDPDGEFRIQVRLPLISNDEDGTWCRVSTLDAGDNRGSFFRPEIEDEVIVGFINNDPRHAVVLGMMNSSKKPAPIEADDQNPVKGFVTRSEMKFLFDDEKKTVTLETPAGNKLSLSEDEKAIMITDQNGNKITMDSNGIKIESAKNVEIIATADLKASGINLDLKADAAAKLNGSASAEIKSSGSTTVQGSIVQIN